MTAQPSRLAPQLHQRSWSKKVQWLYPAIAHLPQRPFLSALKKRSELSPIRIGGLYSGFLPRKTRTSNPSLKRLPGAHLSFIGSFWVKLIGSQCPFYRAVSKSCLQDFSSQSNLRPSQGSQFSCKGLTGPKIYRIQLMRE